MAGLCDYLVVLCAQDNKQYLRFHARQQNEDPSYLPKYSDGRPASVIISWFYVLKTTSNIYIKSHAGHTGNELADVQAKQGAIEGPLDAGVELPKSYLKYEIKEAFQKIWENKWLNKNKEKRDFDYRQSKLWIQSFRKDISEEIGDLPREVASQVIGLITGHCKVRYHLNKIKPDLHPTSLCRLCENNTEDTFHLVFRCPRIRVERAQSFGSYDIAELDKTKWKVKQLVSLLNNSSIRDMLKYSSKEENNRTTQD